MDNPEGGWRLYASERGQRTVPQYHWRDEQQTAHISGCLTAEITLTEDGVYTIGTDIEGAMYYVHHADLGSSLMPTRRPPALRSTGTPIQYTPHRPWA